jgi:hypothetical protein
MGLYSSNCRRFFVCIAVNWEPLDQFTSNYNFRMKNWNFTKKYTDHKTINSNNYAKFEVNWPRSSQFTAWHTKNRLQLNCRWFFVCRTVNWEPLGQFTSNFSQLLELIVLQSVYFLVKFWFFIPELWERKSLQILYECWRRAYHAIYVICQVKFFFDPCLC